MNCTTNSKKLLIEIDFNINLRTIEEVNAMDLLIRMGQRKIEENHRSLEIEDLSLANDLGSALLDHLKKRARKKLIKIQNKDTKCLIQYLHG